MKERKKLLLGILDSSFSIIISHVKQQHIPIIFRERNHTLEHKIQNSLHHFQSLQIHKINLTNTIYCNFKKIIHTFLGVLQAKICKKVRPLLSEIV